MYNFVLIQNDRATYVHTYNLSYKVVCNLDYYNTFTHCDHFIFELITVLYRNYLYSTWHTYLPYGWWCLNRGMLCTNTLYSLVIAYVHTYLHVQAKYHESYVHTNIHMY